MATRNGGGRSSNSSTGRTTASGTSANRQQRAATTRQTGNTSREGATAGASAGQSSARGVSPERTRNASSNQSATNQGAMNVGTTSQDASGQRTPSSYSTDQSSTDQSQSSASTGSSSSIRGDREREVRTSREQGSGVRSSSSAQRGNIGQQSGAYSAPAFGWGSGSPFAMMRRMMDDMDRLFSEFGLMHPGQLASTFGGDVWPSSQSSQRALGGSPGGGSLTPSQPGGQQGMQRGGQRGGGQSLQGLWSPQVEVFERGNNLVVRADLPGLSREDVDVELDNDALVIRGHRHNEFEDDQEGFYRSERSYGSFYRAIPLPENVDLSSCDATFKDGVLEVTLPKPQSQQSRSKRIEVR
jgi:HSP20 family protein